jgi:hypothetical protein
MKKDHVTAASLAVDASLPDEMDPEAQACYDVMRADLDIKEAQEMAYQALTLRKEVERRMLLMPPSRRMEAARRLAELDQAVADLARELGLVR